MIEHGTRSCYVKNGCRREECVRANSEYFRRRRKSALHRWSYTGLLGGRLDGLRKILREHPGEWFFVRAETRKNAASALQMGLRSCGDDEFMARIRVTDSGRRVVEAMWAGMR